MSTEPPPSQPLKTPLGCDTFVSYPPTTPHGIAVFGKNSDRPSGETQSIQRYPARRYDNDSTVKCTYITIPQAKQTHAVLLSQIDWMWGAEHGANEHGVVIGNEAVWTKVNDDLCTKRLLGMDLVRLGLERGSCAKESLEIITELLKVHGQGGACAQDDDSFVYHNSFLIADCKEGWILETAGRHWVAKRINKGARNISNVLTIRTDYDLSSDGLIQYAHENKLYKDNDTTCEKLDWALCFGDGCVEECNSPYSRQSCGAKLLRKYDNSQKMDEKAMMGILKSHDGICMHGGFETTAAMVSVLRLDGEHAHWMLDRPHPCKNDFIAQSVLSEGQ